jgi:iron(III) transport system ATP-binding protein
VSAEGTGQAFPVRASALGAAGPPVLPVGSTAVVAIRPTGVRLTPASRGEHHLTGVISDVAFRGRGYEHAIDIAGHGRLTGVFSEVRGARGDQVGLRLEAAGVHLFPAEEASGPLPGGERAGLLIG